MARFPCKNTRIQDADTFATPEGGGSRWGTPESFLQRAQGAEGRGPESVRGSRGLGGSSPWRGSGRRADRVSRKPLVRDKPRPSNGPSPAGGSAGGSLHCPLCLDGLILVKLGETKQNRDSYAEGAPALVSRNARTAVATHSKSVAQTQLPGIFTRTATFIPLLTQEACHRLGNTYKKGLGFKV